MKNNKLRLRKEMSSEYQWNLDKVFSSNKEWETSYELLINELDVFLEYKNKLSLNGNVF